MSVNQSVSQQTKSLFLPLSLSPVTLYKKITFNNLSLPLTVALIAKWATNSSILVFKTLSCIMKIKFLAGLSLFPLLRSYG